MVNKKILVVSDTHGDPTRLIDTIEKEKPFDIMIHCGDAECSEGRLMMLSDTTVYGVQGNNDYFYDYPAKREFEINGIKFYLTHGHLDGVHFGIDKIGYAAKAKGAKVALYGHTHIPHLEEMEGITFLNPGSLTYPRQIGRKPTYAIINISEDGNMTAEIKDLYE